ncbi:uncharacterized protein EAF01_008450 [Botrytis porri]|uniref:uncharacterized protein n=1 Tax=Botrytis porri TaxID=87229 RepID=UPI001902A88F|nr:uncharacterized protein EAF01_008450 [Botrytis porri]KAF7899237.1 hypothetical protein EAF01_008450 [Botrytis porri]
MPSIAQEDWDIPSMDFHMSTNGAVNLLKRRRDVANFADAREEDVQMKIHSPRHSHIHPHNLYPHTIHHDSERRHLIPRSKMSLNKRVRVDYLPSEPESRIESTKEKEKEKNGSGMDLRACHICHRKPTVKKELDAFANCEGCGKRACWVCIRECLGGWGNTQMGEEAAGKEGWGEKGTKHRGMVCSRCCVERGTEGDVLCLGCLRMERS